MTRLEKKNFQLQRIATHLTELKALGFCGPFEALQRLEKKAHRFATQSCNGKDIHGHEYDDTAFEIDAEKISCAVAKLFGGKLPEGFQINGDARGFALKIDDVTNRTDTAPFRKLSYSDCGGNGILAPATNDFKW